MNITRQWFAEQMRRIAVLSADPSTTSVEQIESRLHVLEASVSAILRKLEESEGSGSSPA
ncbi:hypothetical protein [Erythrobacter mangrovi]|uniref:MarR family transcriptional regulator n=1 Tax=Erythrobacter mangrovi TaxID=2739433 RepID=A0A7D4C2Z2_9SPHN|nr:hypothetical protein [Erythrobacter mangrovi]QKG70645.1 hypothetical protein HQR01_04250 [Erythrobacter mangrovi]